MTEEGPLLVGELWGRLPPELREALPGVTLALGLLVAGWLLAVGLRRMAWRVAALLNRAFPGRARPAPAGGRWAGLAAYWATLAVFALLAVLALSPATFLGGLDFLNAVFPRFLAALLVLGSGLVLGVLARSLTQLTARNREVARGVQYAVVAVAAVTAADQLGFQVTFLVVLGAVAAGALLGGLALAAGLGSRHLVADLVGARQLQGAFRPGEVVRVAGYEGRILEHTATGLLLDCREGRVWVPGHYFHREPIVALRERADDRE
jgi:small-conductance mechanosensitive channel